MTQQINVRRAAFLVGLLASVSWSCGQVHLIQQGNVLDANLQLGSGGLNRAIPPQNFNAGNRIVTGNVTGGSSFRGYSPIGDPSSLFQIGRPMGVGVAGGNLLSNGSYYGLPSEQLYSFNRDSFNIYEAQAASPEGSSSLNRAPRPYYSPYSTTTDVNSILAGMNRPGSTFMRGYGGTGGSLMNGSNDSVDGAETPRPGTMLQVPTSVIRADTGQTLTGAVDSRLMQSSLFGNGVFREVPVPMLAADAQRSRYLAPPTRGPTPVDMRISGTEPLDQRVDLRAAQTATNRPLAGRAAPSDRGGNETGAPYGVSGQEHGSGHSAPKTGAAGQPPSANSAERTGTSFRKTPEGSMLRPVTPGKSREEDLAARDNGSLMRPLTPGQKPTPPGTLLEPPVGGGVSPQLLAAMGDWTGESIKTFVGTEQTRTNQYLAEAERLMKAGQYYKAADQYNLARSIDIHSPIPLVGRAMALLAAGEYMTSANNLFQAIRQMQTPGVFAVDLRAFVPDLATLDRRRADLEKRLEQADAYQLRFLLGFAEYCSGLRKLGLSNLEKAAAAAPADLSALGKFVQQLKIHETGPVQPAPILPETAK